VNRSMNSVGAIVPLLMCLLLAPAAGAADRTPQAQATELKQELIGFEKVWWEAFKTRDKDALERILADEFVGFDDDTENPTTKSRWIDGALDKNFRVDSYSIERIDVIVVADTAVAAVHFSAHLTENGKARSVRAIDLDTLVRRNGRWQAVATGELRPTNPK
jgi:hypothetical protein